MPPKRLRFAPGTKPLPVTEVGEVPNQAVLRKSPMMDWRSGTEAGMMAREVEDW